MDNWIITADDTGCVVHSGILGMKWGRRRYQNKDGSLTPEGRLRYGDKDAKRTMTSRQLRRNMKNMSDAELQEAINRKSKEKQLRDMLDEEISPGKKKAEEILSRIGSDVAVSVGSSAAKTGLHYILTKLAGNNETAQDLVRSMNITSFGKDKHEWDMEAKKYKRDQARKAAEGPDDSKRVGELRQKLGRVQTDIAEAKAKMQYYDPAGKNYNKALYDKAVEDYNLAVLNEHQLKKQLS